MSLKEQISDDMKAAMRAKDSGRLATIRLINAAIKQKEVDERIELNDDQVLSVIEKMIKQRKDSITQFEAGGRQDLADNENFEVGVLQVYMPKALSEAEVADMVASAVTESGARAPGDMGKVMAVLKERFAGRMDFGAASGAIKSKLG